MSTKDHQTERPVTPGSDPGSDNSPVAGALEGGESAGPVARPAAEHPSRSRLRGALGSRGRRRVAAGLVLLVVVAVAAGVVLGTRSSSSRPATGVRITGTAMVQRRDLVETDTESGTISHANPQTVYDRLDGTITWLPSVGRLIKPGRTLYEVDGHPVILMNGTTPAYRDLSAGDSPGQDILQLNRDLVALGFGPEGIVVNDAWQWATTAGVQALQASLREPETGSLSLGHIVFLPGDRIVSSVDASLGSVGGGGAGGPSSTGSAPSSTGSAGGGAGAAPVLQTTSTQLIVTVDLDASKQSEAKVGETVTVEMPAGNNVGGVITAVSPIAASSSSSSSGSSSGPGSSPGSQATIPVTIQLKGRVSGAGLDQAPVSVNFAQAVANNVLSVPVTALLATSGGGYAVQQAQAPHQLIPVTMGLFAAGYVQISGPGIYQGMQVTNSQG